MTHDNALDDRLLVHGIHFVGKHGVYDYEREHGRRFRVDLEVGLSTVAAAASDDLGDAVDYRRLASAVMDVGQGPSRHLIEALGEAMIDRLFAECPIRWVDLTLRKYADGVPGDPEWVAVRLQRRRADT